MRGPLKNLKSGVYFRREIRPDSTRVRRIAGILADAETAIVKLHQDCTKIAQDNNVDLPVIAGGGGR